MTQPYRDGRRPLETEVARLADEVRTLALTITPGYFSRLDGRLARWREHVEAPPPDSPDGWRARLDLLSGLRDDLRQAIEQAPRIEAALRALPRSVPPAVIRRPPRHAVELSAAEWIVGPYARLQRLEARLARIVGRHDERALVQAWPGHALVTRFEALGAPMAIHAERLLTGGIGITAATSMARGAPDLYLRRRRWHDHLARALRLSRPTHLGTPAFDERFTTTGARGARLLTPPIQRQLTELDRWVATSLRVEDGAAVLRFRYPFTIELIERALCLLAELRHAPLPLVLVRPAEGHPGERRR